MQGGEQTGIEMKRGLEFFNFEKSPEIVQKTCTGPQSIENFLISQVKPGALSACSSVPIQLKQFIESPSNNDSPIESWCEHNEFKTSGLAEVCLLPVSNASVERKNSRGTKIMTAAPATKPPELGAKLFHKSVKKKMPQLWESSTKQHIMEAYSRANIADIEGADVVSSFLNWDAD